jgi:hypothetical protein
LIGVVLGVVVFLTTFLITFFGEVATGAVAVSSSIVQLSKSVRMP